MPSRAACRPSPSQNCLAVLREWERVLAYLELVEGSSLAKEFGKTLAYLLACMRSESHKQCVTAAGIVAGSVYVPTLDAVETLQAEGLPGIAQVANTLQHIFEWTMSAGADATEVLKGEV
jgi:hypothetical protein